jgi:hypothetical protein
MKNIAHKASYLIILAIIAVVAATAPASAQAQSYSYDPYYSGYSAGYSYAAPYDYSSSYSNSSYSAYRNPLYESGYPNYQYPNSQYPYYQKYQQYPQYSNYGYPETQLSVTCSANTKAAYADQPVVWTAYVSGGTGHYFFDWTGEKVDDSNTNTIVVKYKKTGPKSPIITVHSGLQRIDRPCEPMFIVPGSAPRYSIPYYW